MTDFVQTRIEDGVGVITLARPPVNAVTVDVLLELTEAFRAAGESADIRCVVLTGEGNVFCAGADMKAIEGDRPRVKDAMVLVDRDRFHREVLLSIYECRVPVVAAVNGPAIGGGACYVACCDVIIAAQEAFFAMTEINVGSLGGYTFAQRLVGPYRARKMFLTGERVSADEVYRYGSIDQVLPRAEVFPAAMEIAREIASKSQVATRLAKESILRSEFAADLEEGYRREQEYTLRLRETDDSKEAGTAFVEGRAPVWEWMRQMDPNELKR